MDLAEPFKPEVLRPVTTLIVPGTIAVGPFVLVLADYVPAVATFWTEHPSAFAVLMVLTVLAAGFIIDDFGAMIEARVWDRLLGRDESHWKNWEDYLKLELKDELIGHRYLRTKLTQMKFELAMAPALIFCWSGLLWLQVVHGMWSRSGFVFITLLLFLGAVYLLWESWKTSKVLSKTRALILQAIREGPKGISERCREAPSYVRYLIPCARRYKVIRIIRKHR